MFPLSIVSNLFQSVLASHHCHWEFLRKQAIWPRSSVFIAYHIRTNFHLFRSTSIKALRALEKINILIAEFSVLDVCLVIQNFFHFLFSERLISTFENVFVSAIFVTQHRKKRMKTAQPDHASEMKDEIGKRNKKLIFFSKEISCYNPLH
jgi:hypothetical protein